MSTQSLSPIVNVTVQVSPNGTSINQLNVGLIVGSSTVIPTATRTATYSSTSNMLTSGWAGTEPEYKAAQLYFSQSPIPTSVVIGRQDLTVPETLLQAITACRASNANWYACYACGAADADVTAIAEYIQSVSPVSVYFYDTQDAAISAGTTPNEMSTLQEDKYSRTFGLYSTTTYSGAAAMGVAMGSNTGLFNSSFTMAYKSLVGVTPEVLTTQQVTDITEWNGNVYTNYGNSYNILVQGTTSDGSHFDQILNQDIMTVGIQTSVMNILTGTTKIPQTDAGVGQLITAVNSVLESARQQDILAPGVWTAAPVLGLATGTNLPTGYITIADKIANQSTTDREARKSPPIYACVKMAGAIEHVVIGLVVNT